MLLFSVWHTLPSAHYSSTQNFLIIISSSILVAWYFPLLSSARKVSTACCFRAVLYFLRDAIGLKDSRHLFIQSEVKPKPIVTRSHAFSRALRQPHVITSSFDWFNVLSVSYVIGQSNYFGFGFTTLKRKPLYYQ